MSAGYFVSLEVLHPEPKRITFYVKADSRTGAMYKLQNYEEANYFVKENPDAKIIVIPSGNQKNRAEGLVPEFLRGV